MADNPITQKNSLAEWMRKLRQSGFVQSIDGDDPDFACGARISVFILLGVLTSLFLLLLFNLLFPLFSDPNSARNALLVLIVAGLATVLLLLYVFQRDFLQPLMHLRRWVHLMRGGNLQAQIPVVEGAKFADLAEDLNVVGSMLRRLSQDADDQLQEHTRHITRKTRSLQILYDLAASINYSRDMGQLLTTFLHTVCDVANAQAASVRLVEDDAFRLIKACGLEKFNADTSLDPLIPLDDYPCCDALRDGKIVWHERFEREDNGAAKAFNPIGIVSVPLTYHDKMLGVFNLYADLRNFERLEEMDSLLLSIGQHCGMAIEKTRLDAEAHRLNIIEEREHISHELHDSLAQTLVSLRFQMRVLDETFESEDKASIRDQFERIENTVDEANTELRELITHFRAPIDKRGMMVAVRQIVRRYQEETSISIFLQQEWPDITLPGRVEIQVLRIIQETLANIRKHSEAHAVRIILRGNIEGQFYVLVEDDGNGFDQPAQSDNPGEHLGLGIMRERAQKIGGAITIDSEPGEGTRVVLTFRHPPKSSDDPLHTPLPQVTLHEHNSWHTA
ncbi:MAG TPA: histidine kinase [Gammaproteobacteria bacterium]|nr:histidine kinase [Gammaproteobacteria bacterium]